MLSTCRRAGVSLLLSLRGRAGAPAGCSPRDSGQLLSSRAGFPRQLFFFLLVSNAFPFFFSSTVANAALQQQLGEANTALRAKEEEFGKLAEERDRLVAQLAELLKKAQKEAEDKETSLLAEFAIERSTWTDKEAMLTSGFHEIKDIVDGELPSFSFFEMPAVGRAGFSSLPLALCFLSRQTSSLSLGRRQPGH